jgi:hypothetical protein
MLLVFFVLACGSNKRHSLFKNDYPEPDTAFYQLNIPDKSNMKEEKPRKIVLQNDKECHIIQFGKFTTETTWKMYDWFSYTSSDKQSAPELIEAEFMAEEEVSINISSLDTGKYMVSFTAIAEGCYFELTVR